MTSAIVGSAPYPVAGDRRPASIGLVLVLAVVASAVGGVIAALAFGMRPELVAALYLAVVTPALVRTDVAEHRLPNRWVLPGYPLALGCLLAAGIEGRPPTGAVVVAALVLVFFGVLAAAGGLGMGDVKLAGLLALVVGPLGVAAVVAAVALAFVVGGIAALGRLVAGGGRRDIAFGPFLLAGAWLVLAVAALHLDAAAVIGGLLG